MRIATAGLALTLLAIHGLPGDARAASCGVAVSGPEVSLQGVFGALLPGGAPDVTSACLPSGTVDAGWVTAPGSPSATVLVEIAGFAPQNVLGIYDASRTTGGLPDVMVPLFSGAATAGTTAVIAFTPNAGGFAVSVNGGAPQQFGSSVFGYYLTTPPQAGVPRTFFSDSRLNPAGFQHVYAYQGTGQSFAPAGLVVASEPGKPSRTVYSPGGLFGPGAFLLAWEDLAGGGDGDYQDMVVLTRDIVPVPLPAAAWLMLSGLALFGAVASRRRADPAPAG